MAPQGGRGKPGLDGPYAMHVGPCRNCSLVVDPDHESKLGPNGDPDHFPVITCAASGTTGSIDLNLLQVKDQEQILWSNKDQNANPFTIDFDPPNANVCSPVAKNNVPCVVHKLAAPTTSYGYTATVTLKDASRCTARGVLAVQ